MVCAAQQNYRLLQHARNSDSGYKTSPQSSVRMVFLLGVNFAESKLLKKSLETFYGLGHQHSSRLLAKFSIHPAARIGSLRQETVTAITAELSNMTIENEARRKLQDNIRRLRDMGSYRGRRHAMGLPVRGQNTRSQVMTARKLNRVERHG